MKRDAINELQQGITINAFLRWPCQGWSVCLGCSIAWVSTARVVTAPIKWFAIANANLMNPDCLFPYSSGAAPFSLVYFTSLAAHFLLLSSKFC